MHNAIDMNGQGVLIRWFAALMRRAELDCKLLGAENVDADKMVPHRKDGEVSLEHDEMRKPSHLNPVNGAAAPPPQGSNARWVHLRFPSDKLAELRGSHYPTRRGECPPTTQSQRFIFNV